MSVRPWNATADPALVGARPRARIAVALLMFAAVLTMRVWGISRHTWMLGDQIRDWAIALGPFRDLPLVGPPTHVGGYTIGPAFYWILWVIRVTVGPWYQNLPHGGGIGQAIVQSAADVLLLLALWYRTRSVWIALAATVLVATAAYDLCLSAIVWNPMMGSALAKIATAVVLFEWPRRSRVGAVVAIAAAWCAVQCYTGAIFVACGVILALLVDPLMRGDRAGMKRHAVIVAVVVAALQIPHALFQASGHGSDGGMSAVTGSVGNILAGRAQPQWTISWNGLANAFSFIQIAPWQADVPWARWVLAACAVIMLIRYRRDWPLLAVSVAPLAAAVIGYALYVGDFLDSYYYFSLMPAAVVTVLLGVTALVPAKFARLAGIALLAGAVALVPTRIRFAQTMHHMPAYGLLLDASRVVAGRHQPMRAIRTAFPLEPTVDPEFMYTILGGRIDRSAPWIALIKADGTIEYQRVGEL